MDSDGDGLSNLQEYLHGTDPHNPDTDGDGLTDGQEVALGTNPLNADTDGDGLSDYAEVYGPFPSNPLLASSARDGISDKTKILLGIDPQYNPTNSPTFVGYVPYYRTSATNWEWNLENIQLVWDHTAGALAPDSLGEDFMVSFQVLNATAGDWRSLGMSLRYYTGSLTYQFYSTSTSAFGNPATIWDTDINSPPIDLNSQLGFSGYGHQDISDRLQFHMLAQRAPNTNNWTVTFFIKNQTSNSVVVSRTFANCTAVGRVDNGTAKWTDNQNVTNQPTMLVHQGVQMFISTNPLVNLPAFAAARDSDKDGMPDWWEDANGFNKFDPSDATQDADGDGVNNRDEYLLGTDPHNRDTDGDGISDNIERLYGSDPLRASSKPAFAGAPWPSGRDLDHNGLPDAWEIRYRAFGLSPNGDEDGDGASNALEAAWGTNPFDASSKPTVTLASQATNLVVGWPYIQGKDQRLFTSTNLVNWLAYNGSTWVSGAVASAHLTNHFILPSHEFYRVRATDLDSDGDGVSDWDELALGTDPYQPDSAHANVPIIGANGSVLGLVPGDYAYFVEQMQGGPAGSAGTGVVSRAQAARFLQQATFGVTLGEIDRIQQMGLSAWIDDQITNTPPSFHRPYIEKIYGDLTGPRTDLTYAYEGQYLFSINCTTPFARAALSGQDQLRQRVAFALSQIIVASRQELSFESKPLAISDFYDIFVRNAFSNYFTILHEVTLHPVMGRYLSHVGNQPPQPQINQYPDENYAREVQQLFTIGLWQLNLDGTRKLDEFGQPIPTYNNSQVTEFARVFTGLWYSGQPWGAAGYTDEQSAAPMDMWVEKHDFNPKTLLNGFVIPERAPTLVNALKDIDDALRNLFQHPNAPPFICKQLIQFLVTSNPSTNYVARVAAKFVNNGKGIRGDLGCVVRAILLDPEARDTRWSLGAPEFGRLKEPVQRAMAIARAGDVGRFTNLLWWTYGDFYTATLQEPGYAPSVFNFYRPNYQPPGLLTQNGLLGPAFQITDSFTAISVPNKLWDMTQNGIYFSSYDFPPDYAELMAQAGNIPQLLDRVNLLFCGGEMTAATRANILNVLQQMPTYDLLARVQLAVYLASTCPEGAVQR
jgi:uncharacterized protein (DUF1800 family)